jgi:hypothetical protein
MQSFAFFCSNESDNQVQKIHEGKMQTDPMVPRQESLVEFLRLGLQPENKNWIGWTKGQQKTCVAKETQKRDQKITRNCGASLPPEGKISHLQGSISSEIGQ